MVTRAADVRTTQQWANDPFETEQPVVPGFLRRHPAFVGFCTAASLLIIGWLVRDKNLYNAEEGVGYVLGILSVACMMVLLLYPLRKKFRLLKFIGPLPRWFRNHMILGVSAPIIALYHCNFQLGSLNSRIALFSALIVAGSGLIGRFIYSKIHRGLYGRKTSLKELLAKVKVKTPGANRLGKFVPELTARITQFDKDVMVPPESMLDCIRLPFVLFMRTRIQYFRLMGFTRLSLAHMAQHDPEIAKHRKTLEKSVRRYVKQHLYHVRRVAEFTAYDRLFSLWHKLHFPFFVVLLITVVVHIAVVHLY